MKIYLIRHGKTAGNLAKRYIGIIDEPLCEEGIRELQDRNYPDCEFVISSPMRRCVETAEIIYPDKNLIICDALSECDFGEFEGKNYLELSEDRNYQNWINSGGTLPFPGGEDPKEFKKRCISSFDEMIKKFGTENSISFVIHGGVIMAVLEHYTKCGFYDNQIKNGEFIEFLWK